MGRKGLSSIEKFINADVNKKKVEPMKEAAAKELEMYQELDQSLLLKPPADLSPDQKKIWRLIVKELIEFKTVKVVCNLDVFQIRELVVYTDMFIKLNKQQQRFFNQLDKLSDDDLSIDLLGAPNLGAMKQVSSELNRLYRELALSFEARNRIIKLQNEIEQIKKGTNADEWE